MKYWKGNYIYLYQPWLNGSNYFGVSWTSVVDKLSCDSKK